ncbi:FO synthase subunit 2 [Mesorhizobium loti]|nr:FO synthase subunit 2 [Mesorhizobium loti]
MRDDVDSVEPLVPCERGSDLPRRRLAAVEHDSPDFGPQIGENRVEIGD